MRVGDSNAMYILQKTMDYSWLKMQLINTNIANVSTPGYKAKRLVFEDEFQRALVTEDPAQKARRIMSNRFKVTEDKAEAVRMDGNNVQIDVENVEMARNQYLYESLVRQMNSEFNKLKTAIGGR